MASYFWQNKQDERNEELAERAAAAHERRMRSRARFIEGNPNAVSPQERAGVMQWQHNQGLTGRESALQQHEMDMLKQRGANDKAVAFERRMGMENQGVGAAKLKYGYTDDDGKYHEGGEERIARQQGKDALTLEEKKLARQKELAEIEAGVKKHEIDTRHKGILDTNDANVEIEEMRGNSATQIARENREAAAAEAEKRRQEGAQATGNKNNQAQEERIRKMIDTVKKDPGSRNLTPAQIRAKALELLGIDEEGTGGLSQFRK